ncbi:MAG: sigma-70 family RNA polymerase sigma factor [Clostridia bacterium]|nr:sigma-70 family RNA polymerase sigma factor [Clostridia bacterium]NCC42070.1 sigma-70 family RNA polymerase sigma factor [Clostridia bacterium]
MTKEQLGELIIASEDSLYHIAKSLLYDDADCADAIQEAIVKAFSKIQTLKIDAYAKTWLVRILINECYALMRRKQVIVPMEDVSKDEPTPEKADYSELYEALSHLPEEMRLTVTMYYMEGYQVKEIASILNTSQSTIKSRLARARARLKQDLDRMEAAGI